MRKLKHLSPYLYVMLSFAAVIILGSILLVLPCSYQNKTAPHYYDALFLSTSAVCVTGLSPFANGLNVTLSTFGKVVLIFLVQIGGLGFITILFFFLTIFGVRFGVSDKYLLKETLNFKSISGILKFVRRIIIITFIVEFFGSLPFMFVFIPEFGVLKGILYSIFHSISSFNNAGFDILGSSSLATYSNNVVINLFTILLIFIGGIGFPVINDICHCIRIKSFRNFTVYSKVVLITTSVLVTFGTLGFMLTENGHITFLQALFQSITTRTAGFYTLDQSKLTFAGQMLSEFLMFIGASPLSTGGGIKTTTLFVIFLMFATFLRRRKDLIAFKRKFSTETVNKAFTLAIVALAMIFICFNAVCVFERGNDNAEINQSSIIFETFSAFGTVGLSQGITPYLTGYSKITLCLLMFAGRLGPMTMVGVFNSNLRIENQSHVEYVEENVVIG